MRDNLMMPGVVRAFPDRAAAEKAGEWLIKSMNETSNPAGGYLAPVAIVEGVYSLLPLAGVIAANAKVRTISSDLARLPKRTGGFTWSFVPEETAETESSAAFGSINFAAGAAGALAKISRELFDDAPALAEFLTSEMAFGYADFQDTLGFNGVGTPAQNGIRGICVKIVDGTHTASVTTAATGHDTFAELDAADLSDLMSLLPEAQWGNASWYVSGYGAAKCFARLGMVAGGTMARLNGPRPVFTYSGFPIKVTPKLPGSGSQTGVPMILFGDMAMAVSIAERRTLSLEFNRSPGLTTRQIYVRVTPRFDLQVHDLGSTTVAGPLVALLGA